MLWFTILGSGELYRRSCAPMWSLPPFPLGHCAVAAPSEATGARALLQLRPRRGSPPVAKTRHARFGGACCPSASRPPSARQTARLRCIFGVGHFPPATVRCTPAPQSLCFSRAQGQQTGHYSWPPTPNNLLCTSVSFSVLIDDAPAPGLPSFRLGFRSRGLADAEPSFSRYLRWRPYTGPTSRNTPHRWNT